MQYSPPLNVVKCAPRAALPRALPRPTLALALTLALLSGCRQEHRSDLGAAAAETEGAPLATRVSPDWVALYDPARAFNGYTLALFERNTPIVIDMNGRLVHAWPEVEARSRVRLLDDGSLLTIALGGSKVQQFDWRGRLIWEYETGGPLPHHDLIRLANGNILLAVVDADKKTDDLLEVDRQGNVVWEWDAGERLAADLPRAPRRAANRTHINSLQELPPNPWFDAGDDRFRPGNLLISARNLDAIYIVERPSGDVVWSLTEGLDQQHEALMNGPDLEAPGFVQLFDNRPRSGRRSAVVELDPRDAAIRWEYGDEGFFSATKGAQQALANGNVLVASSRGRRAFEVTREGDVVWQWTPPFELLRPQRYAYDHCPQLGDLARPQEEPVLPAPGYRYVDRELYELVRRHERIEQWFGLEERSVLRRPNRCRFLLLPEDPELRLEFGLGTGRIADAGLTNGSDPFAARFSTRVRALPDGTWRELFAETVSYPDDTWRERRVAIDGLDFRSVELCLTIERPGGGNVRGFAYWSDARISPALRPADPKAAAEQLTAEQLTAEQLEERRRHLETLGYID